MWKHRTPPAIQMSEPQVKRIIDFAGDFSAFVAGRQAPRRFPDSEIEAPAIILAADGIAEWITSVGDLKLPRAESRTVAM